MLYQYVEYIAIKFNYSDGLFKKTEAMIGQIKQKQSSENNEILYF